jgi:hypothetical protein
VLQARIKRRLPGCIFVRRTAGVSVERQLSFGEDKLFVGALILDIALYFAIVLLAVMIASQLCAARCRRDTL